MSLSFFIGLQAVSLLVGAAVLFEYWRVCRAERSLLAALGRPAAERLAPALLAAAYLASIIGFAAVTGWILSIIAA
jgi:hypothetical protein